jgi:predicted AlkP superfamily phosphohydrolase/phosphomutase
MARRVLMIGLDGASPTLIEKWKDHLPNLSRLMTDGSWGVLRSTVPPYTLPAWPSMVTGVQPGKLGIFGFRRRLPGTSRFSFSTLSDSPVPPVWEILGLEGRRSVIAGLPSTYPPQELNGIMISGFPAPANDGRLVFTFPEELSRQLDRRFGQYELQVYESYEPGKEQAFIDACKRVAEIHWETAHWLAKTQSWDCLAFVSLTIDRASHYLWRFMDSDHPEYDPEQADRWGSAILDLYCLEDDHLDRLLDLASDDDLVLVTSDHGFCGRHRTFFINEWLRRKGYLKLKGRLTERGWLGRVMAPIVGLYQQNPWARALMAPLRGTGARDRLMSYHHAHRSGRLRMETAPIDWDRTVAYGADQHRIYLNEQAYDSPGEAFTKRYDSVLARLADELGDITDEQGNSLSAEVLKGREIYDGPFAEEGPDLLLFLDNYHCDVNSSLGGRLFGESSVRLSGTHHPHGLIMMRGPGVRPARRIEADIVDIAPTILHALDAPVLAESDGQPIWAAFDEASEFARRPVREISHAERARREQTWSAEEEAQVMGRLRELGYL